MSRTFVTVTLAAALGAALVTTASAQPLKRFGNTFSSGQPMMQTGTGSPTFQRQDSGRRPHGPQTHPPGWQPTFAEKSGKLDKHLSKGQPLSQVDGSGPGFMKAPPKYSYPHPHRPRRPGDEP